MPFKSDKQRKFLYAKKPEVAEKFAAKEKKKRKSDPLARKLSKQAGRGY